MTSPSTAASMKPRRHFFFPDLTSGHAPLRFFTVTVVGTVVVLVSLGWYVYSSYQVTKQTIGRDFRLKELVGTIMRLDEVLTMSARMAAVTGNAEWEERYLQFEPILDGAIKEAGQLAPETQSGAAASQTDSANQQLVEMEHRAMQLAREERLAEAQAVVFSQEYDAQKWIYSQGMEQFTALLERRVASGHAERRIHALFSIFIIIVTLILSIVTWTAVLWVLQRWQEALVKNNRQLERAADELRELNKTLDYKVADRTEALNSRNEDLGRQQQAMRGLLAELQASQAAMETHNQELARREEVMQSLLEDLNTAKERIEQQTVTLQAANTKLKELAMLKDEFVAKVSHELRTPLTSVKEGLSLLLDNALGNINTEQRDFVSTMDHDIDRLTELINNMLDISKIEAGRMRLIRSRVEMPQLIESLSRSYQAIMGHRTIRSEVAASVPPVFGDANRLVQILTNLLSNAIKFTRDDGHITFRLSCQDHMVVVAVEDDGAGVAADDLPKLFRKFSQVGSAAAAGAPRGTGLGLVVCKELAELHGGAIDVTSRLGQGTAFTVRLPVYSETLALTESFREQLQAASQEEGQMASLIAVQASALMDPRAPAGARQQRLEQLAQEVREHLHRGDTVVTLEPSWIVVTAVTEASGLKAIVRRLREKVRDGQRLRFGMAMHPQDGTEAMPLFQHAIARLHDGPSELRAAQAPEPTKEPT